MGKQIKLTITYVLSIFNTSFREIWTGIGMWGKLLDGLLIISGIVGAIVVNSDAQFLINDLNVWIYLSVFALFIIPFLAIINMPRVSAIQNDEQAEWIKVYEGNRLLARAEKLIVTPVNEHVWIGIKVHNTENKDYRGFIWITNVDGRDLSNPIRLTKHNDRVISGVFLPTQTFITLEIAQAIGNGKAFLMGENYTEHEILPGKHVITTHTGGEFELYKIDPIVTNWWLFFDQEANRLEINKVINAE